MLYSYFFNMLKVGVPGATQVPQLLVYNQNFPGLLCPESLEDTAFDAMSSKLADNDGGATQT